MIPSLLGLLQLRPLAEQCAALEAEKILVEEETSRSSSYMDLCVCRKKYCWELTILCLCIWSTSNDRRLDLQLELPEVTPIFTEIHHIALCSLSSPIDRGVAKEKLEIV